MGTTTFVNLGGGTITGATTFLDTITLEPATDIAIPAGEDLTIAVGGTNEFILSGSNLDIVSNPLEMNNLIDWDTGVAITAASYQVGRDLDGTNQLHFNVPTGASFEWSVNDATIITANVTTPLNVSKITTNSIGDVSDYALNVIFDSISLRGPGLCWSTSVNNATKSKASIFPANSSNGSNIALGTSSAYASGVNVVPLWASFDGSITVGGSTTAPIATTSAVINVTGNVVTSGIKGEVRINTAAHTGQTASTERIGFNYVTNTIQWATGALTTQREWVIAAPTYGFVGASTITTAATLAVTAAPIAGTNATITNPLALWVQAGGSRFDGRQLNAQGADVASANDLTLGLDGNTFEITGTTQINAITIANWQNGTLVRLLFTSNPTVKHNTAGGAGTAPILLAGGVDFGATAGDGLTLLLSEIGGTQAWREQGRTVI